MIPFDIIETQRLILKGISHEAMDHLFENYAKADIKRILGHRSEDDYLKQRVINYFP